LGAGFAVVIASALMLGTIGCGDDDSEEAPEATASVERFCELSRELDRAGEEQFEALEEDPNATREDFEAAERELVEENEDALEEIQEAAPAEINDDVAVLVEALRARAGLADEMPSDADEAERRINGFEEENCVQGDVG
jgi:hypothetical protein